MATKTKAPPPLADNRLLYAARVMLPLAMAITALAVFLYSGREMFAATFAAMAGAAFGLLLYLLLRTMALLVGDSMAAPPPPDERLQELENNKRMLLRSIREIELDAQLGKLNEADANELVVPLRQRAVDVLRDIDEARVLVERGDKDDEEADEDTEAVVEREIEAELRRRLTTFGQ